MKTKTAKLTLYETFVLRCSVKVNGNMEKVIENLIEASTKLGIKIVACLLTYVIGSYVIKQVVKLLSKSRLLRDAEGTVRTFAVSFVRIALYVILFIMIVGIMGVPMASIITVLASAGVAIGMAMQGALGNIAGGIVLMVFKPFKLGDYISNGEVEGTVRELNLFYTVVVTVDNKRITVPNGTMMNASITDYSSEKFRRVDLKITCGRDVEPSQMRNYLYEETQRTQHILSDPKPAVVVNGITDQSLEYAVRVWCRTEDYWDVYNDLLLNLSVMMEKHHIKTPAVRVMNETNENNPEINSK